jgi:ribosome maturation factor RimP
MASTKMNTAAFCERLAEPVADQLGLRIWDVRFEKEGNGWFLRYFIEKTEGELKIEDCENFSRALDPILDKEDPITQSYCLEVSSPGIDRQLTRPWHFAETMGKMVCVRLIRPQDGLRDFAGALIGYDGQSVTLHTKQGDFTAPLAKTAYVRLEIADELFSSSRNKGEKPHEQ